MRRVEMWLRYGHVMDVVANIIILVGIGMIAFAVFGPAFVCGPIVR